MEQGLKIKIGADVSQATAGIKQVAAAADKLPKSAGKATAALTDVSRVLADLPYGIRGVANNLEQLGASLGRVSFKDFIKGLAGPGGMIIGLSLVTSALTAAELKYGSLAGALEALTSGTNTAAQAQRDISKAFNEAVGSASGEVAKINALVAVARDYTLGKKAQQQAIDVLNKEYDKFLPKLTLENINTKETSAAVDKLTASLIRQAKARGLQDLIAKEAQKQTQLYTEAATDNLTVLDYLKLGFSSVGRASAATSEAMVKGAKRTNEAFDKSTQRAKIFEEQLQKILGTEAIEGTLFGDGGGGKDKKEQDALKQRIANLEKLRSEVGLLKKEASELIDLKIQLVTRDQKKLGLSSLQLQRVIDDIVREGGLTAEIPATIKFDPKQQSKVLSFDIAPATTNITALIEEAGKAANAIGLINEQWLKMQETAARVGDFLTNQLSSAFTNLFENIMSGGKNAFQDFGQAIAGVVKKLIAAAITAAIFSAIIGAATGGASFGGGATNFLGGLKFFLGKIGGMTSFAQGGVTSGPTLAMVGDNPSGREAIIPLERLGDFMGGGNLQASFERDRMIIWLEQGYKKFGRHS